MPTTSDTQISSRLTRNPLPGERILIRNKMGKMGNELGGVLLREHKQTFKLDVSDLKLDVYQHRTQKSEIQIKRERGWLWGDNAPVKKMN
ncbi:hypothetical protein CEXT_243071 [Caerostris extrusa]|uniref:Uncharacterized protein n=1 Tax=Caerostris extrusa TaxID=172846 RepID=A0AAV4S9I0_CAEEX|nr:hypothetical protein CEXT_243071 [Caerostris extrusa]